MQETGSYIVDCPRWEKEAKLNKKKKNKDDDTSQTYLLLQTLLLLFWLHPCMIWTKLTRTEGVFSRATRAVFFCAGLWIFWYAGKIPKKYIKNQRSGSFQ